MTFNLTCVHIILLFGLACCVVIFLDIAAQSIDQMVSVHFD